MTMLRLSHVRITGWTDHTAPNGTTPIVGVSDVVALHLAGGHDLGIVDSLEGLERFAESLSSALAVIKADRRRRADPDAGIDMPLPGVEA